MKKDPRTLIHTPADLASEHLAWAKRNIEEPGIPWGIPAVDRYVIPMRPGDLIGLIGRPGHGKSSLMAYLARAHAKRIMARGTADKEAVVYVTWESSAEEIENFFIADDQVSASDIAWGRADIEEIKRRAVKRARVPIWVIGHGIGRASPNTPRMTVDVVYQAIESMEEDYGIRPALVLLDYMQLIPVMRAESRVERVTDAVIRAKELAQRAAVPVVAGVQARRDVDNYKYPIPEKSDAQWACLAGDVKILNSQSGTHTTAIELWKTMHECGHHFSVYALDENTLKIGKANIVAAKRNPKERIYKLICSDGSTIRANARHRFYTQHGWTKLSELSLGDYVAMAKRLPELSWRQIVSIEPDGFEHTYDFHVPGLNNFVANDFVVHNSGVEQTVDKLFGLWRPILSPGFENMVIEIEGINGTIVVNDKLLIMRMLKQRFEDGRRTWALYFAPQYLKLAEMELRNNY